MSWITVLWSMGAAVCLTLALIHLAIWVQRRSQVAHLLFALTALGAVGNAVTELGMMKATTVEAYAIWLRISFVSAALLIVSFVFYVRKYYGTGRFSLAAALMVVWTVLLIVDGFSPFSPIFSEIFGLQIVQTPWGEPFAVAKGVISPLNYVNNAANVSFLLFLMDASLTLWRRGERRRAVLGGGAIVSAVVAAILLAQMTDAGVLRIPYVVTFIYLGTVILIGYPLISDALRAVQLTRQLQTSDASLRESEARFGTIADAAPVLIWMSGVDKLCIFFNKPWLEFTGRSLEQEMGNGWAEGVHPDDFQRCLDIYVSAFDAREPFVMQYRLRRHDGEYRWISDNGVPRYDAKKNFVGYIGSCVDITELRRNEQALRESEERMTMAMDAANLGLWEWNVSKDELWGSKTRLARLGLPPSGKLSLEQGLARVHIDDRDRVRQTLRDAARTGKDYHLEYRVVLADGSVRWTEHRGGPVLGATSESVVLRGVSIDITEQKRAEEKFRLAVEASPSGILLVDQSGQIVLVNSHIEKLFGYGREELIGRPVEILVPERFAGRHPEHRAKFLAAPTARAMGVGRELFGRRKDGNEFPVEIGLSPIQTAEGMLVLAAVVDISARKLAEAEAIQRREELGHLSRVAVMGELTASIAHELNQPLSGIISNASAGQRFIDRGDVDLRELRELLADIVADGRRAGDVIRGIQTMVRKGGPTRQRLNVNDLVANVVHMINPNAMHHSCEVQTLLDPNLPPIEADPIQLQQVLINLVINAFDAMRNTPLSRRKVVIATERNGDGVICMSVRDYGTGISEEARERLFDHFFTTKTEGLGMGLGIVRSIVESHGGTVAAENVDGGGARFHFTLPASAAVS